MTKLGFIGVGVLLAGGLATVLGAAHSRGGVEPLEGSLFAARRGSLSITLTETGTLKTKSSAQISSDIEGNAKIAWLADEGASVTQGAVVCELDKTEMQTRVDDLENKVVEGESELKTARSELAIQLAQNKTDLEKAELRVEVARVNMKKLTDGDIPKEERTRKLAIDKAKSTLERAQEKWKSMPGLLKLGFVTKSQVEEERLKVEEARVTLESAAQDLELYERFQKPLDLKTKQSELDEAEGELSRAKEKADSQKEQKEAVVKQRTTTLKSTNEHLAKAKKELEKMTLRAPTAGVVVYGDIGNRWASREIKVGAQVWGSNTIVTLPDTSEFAVVIKVHEADIDKLKIGQKAAVTLDTYKGLMLTGEVAKIASVANANDSWGEEDVKKFAVDIAIQEKNLKIRPGITAKAELAVGALKDVVFVPAQAVFAREGKFRCFVRSAARTAAREVEIGQANDQFVEVKKGLSEGERVLLYDPEAGEVEAQKQAAPAAPPDESPGPKP